MRKAPPVPKRFKFGPYAFFIKEVEHPGKERTEDGRAANDGYTDLDGGVVYICAKQTPYRKALILHHELGHVIWYVFGGTKAQGEERAEEHSINVYSTGYIMAEQENPTLMEYFDYYLRNKR